MKMCDDDKLKIINFINLPFSIKKTNFHILLKNHQKKNVQNLYHIIKLNFFYVTCKQQQNGVRRK